MADLIQYSNLLPVYLSYGMGVDSTAILLRWILEPESRDFDLSQLTVMTAMTGDEFGDTKRFVQKYILPLLRQHKIRYVQVSRTGQSQSDGITVLSDSRETRRMQMRGPYTLFDELALAGTVPNFGGEHRCSLKFKAWVLTEWMKTEIGSNPCRHVFGYSAEEQSRISKSETAFAALNEQLQTVSTLRVGAEPTHRLILGYSAEETKRIKEAQHYNTKGRIGQYPLCEWGWGRQQCEEYITSKLGVLWEKSACCFCPFSRLTPELIERWTNHPRRTAKALVLEFLSLSLNPRRTLFKNTTLHEQLADVPEASLIWKHYNQFLNSTDWNLYRVRRIYTAKGKADRCLQILDTGSRQEMAEALDFYNLDSQTAHGITYKTKRQAEPGIYPFAQEYFTIAPAIPQEKARYGIEWFEERWDRIVGEKQQLLFA
ncbi:MAG: hypothetical protein JST84_05325 [Acidobacteria bacterium]|nr:hypothetical protein [Acidobacteriota bacterium]